MKAAWIEGGASSVREVPDPVPGPDEALVRITTAGVCHSDLHVAKGDWGFPMAGIVGHEAIGVVEALGPGAERHASVGTRVILGLGGLGGYWCGACEYCLRGKTRLCPQSRPVFGTFAELYAVWAPSLVALPDEIADEEAPLACGGLTAYGAVKKLVEHRIQPGRRVAVVGAAGGLGHYAVQLASTFGYEVVGVDVGVERLDFVRSLGAAHTVDAEDAREVIGALGGVDASLVFSARMAGFHLGLDVLKPGGLFVAVGIPGDSEGAFELNPFALFTKDPTIIYSAVGTVQDMRELVAMAAAGKVRTHVSRHGTLADLDTIFGELERAAYLGRAVIRPADTPTAT